MIEFAVLFIVFLFFIFASFEDFKKREVYDYINFLFLIVILLFPIYELLFENNLDPLKLSLYGAFIAFAIGTLLFFLGIWGGGDIKFLIGFGAATNYITGFTNSFSHYSNFIISLDIIPNSISFMFSYILYFLVLVNLIALSFMLYQFFKKRISKRNDFLVILASLFLFTLALVTNINFFSVVILSFIAFLCLFFADEELFNLFYLRKKVNVHSLNERDRVDEDIYEKGEILIPYQETTEGLNKSQIEKIKLISKDSEVVKRIVLPFLTLFGINILFVSLKLVDFTSKAFEIFSFLLFFLFVSFLAGGIAAILIIFYTFIRYHKQIDIKYSIYEKLSSLVFFLISLVVLLIYNLAFAIPFFLISLSILFFRLTKEGEKFMFVADKDIEKIVLGDWIVQDIKIKGETIYTKEDFKLGIDEVQLEKLKKLAKKNKEVSKLQVKDGIPFIPVLFLGFILVLLI